MSVTVHPVFLVTTNPTADPGWVLTKNGGIRAVAGISSTLSVFGSALIILSYLCFRSLRTRARFILVHLSIADMGVGLANLIGIAVNFDHYYHHHHSPDEPEPFKPNVSIDNLCKTQAFFAEYCTLCSVLWTSCLAVYMYLLIVNKNQKYMKVFMWFCYAFCYGMSLIVTVWMLLTQRLGYAPYDSSGWCSIIVVRPYMLSDIQVPRVDMMSNVIGYDLWMFLTIILILVLYISVYSYVKQEYYQLKKTTDASVFWQAMYKIDYKFIMIPLMFIVLRIWTVLTNIILIYLQIPPNNVPPWILKALLYLAGVGDSGQGFVNALLFVAFTHSVRKRLLSCKCLKRLRRQRNVQEEGSIYSESRFLIKTSEPIGYEQKRYHSLPQEDVVCSASEDKMNRYSPSLETVTPISGTYSPAPYTYK